MLSEIFQRGPETVFEVHHVGVGCAPGFRLLEEVILYDRVLAERPGIGAAPMFACPKQSDTSIRYERASDWLRKAETFPESRRTRDVSGTLIEPAGLRLEKRCPYKTLRLQVVGRRIRSSRISTSRQIPRLSWRPLCTLVSFGRSNEPPNVHTNVHTRS